MPYISSESVSCEYRAKMISCFTPAGIIDRLENPFHTAYLVRQERRQQFLNCFTQSLKVAPYGVFKCRARFSAGNRLVRYVEYPVASLRREIDSPLPYFKNRLTYF
jgi:hypothetical protein